MSPSAITGAWIFFVLSLACPPLLLISAPVLVVVMTRVARRFFEVRRSRDYYREERNLMSASKLWRSR